jgi:alanine dehydrogenase
MLIGIPKEIKTDEYRIGATPELVKTLVAAGHTVRVQSGAAVRIGYSDADYQAAGAQIVASAKEAWDVEMVIKVKEPQPAEFGFLREGLLLFTYLHLAPDPVQTKALIDAKVVGVAYETVTDAQKRLPLLLPMSEIAGRIAIQAGGVALHMHNGGRGVLVGAIAGVEPARVTIVGAGVSGTHAMRSAIGLGAQVTVLDVDLGRLRAIEEQYGNAVTCRYSSRDALEAVLPTTDLLVLAVLIPGKQAPKLITRELLKKMPAGSVLVDIAIDQGGCAETSRATTHSKPTFVEEGVIHYCVANMPGACARTATQALSQATMRHALALANLGWRKALLADPHLRAGLNVCLGHVTYKDVAEDLGYEYVAPDRLLMENHFRAHSCCSSKSC